MEIFERRVNQVIQIGPDIRVMVVRIKGPAVKLGVDAPQRVPVHRLEIQQAIEAAERPN